MELKPLPNAKGEKREKGKRKLNKTLKKMKKNNIFCIELDTDQAILNLCSLYVDNVDNYSDLN